MMTELLANVSEEQALRAGGKLWENYGKRRVYLDWLPWAHVEIDYYKTGNIRSAAINGDHISNATGNRLLGIRVYWEDGTVRTNVSDDTLTDYSRFLPGTADLKAVIAEAVTWRIGAMS